MRPCRPPPGASKNPQRCEPPLFKKIIALCAALLLALGAAAPALAEEAAAPPLSAGAACLMDTSTGQILYEKNMDAQLPPASITKIMTALLGVENSSWEDTVTMTDASVFSVPRSASHLALTPGEQLTMEQALMGAMLPSANDAANGIAETVGGTIENFVEMMNARAAELGARSTHFVNANGLDDAAHLTTARDMALITRAALQNEAFVRVFSTAEYVIPPTNKQAEARNIGASNKMMFDFTKYYYPGIIGGKSGYTTEAGHTLVSAAQRDGRTLISVVLAEPKNAAMYEDSVALLDYGFNAFTSVTLTPQELGAEIEAADAALATEEPVTLLLAAGTGVDSLQKSYQVEKSDRYGMTVRVGLSLPEGSSGQYSEVASAELRYVVPLAAASAGAGAAPEKGMDWKAAGLTALKWLGVAAGAALAIFVCLLLYVRLRYDIRRLMRRYRRRHGGAPRRMQAPRQAPRRPDRQPRPRAVGEGQGLSSAQRPLRNSARYN